MQKKNEKIVSIRIGALEADYMVESYEKTSGALAPLEEKYVKIWLAQDENNYYLKSLFKLKERKKTVPIIPFDLEEMFK